MTVDTTIYRAGSFIDAALSNLALLLAIAAVLVAVVIGAFLLQWRAVVIALVAIATSVMAAGLVLLALGATINAISVAGLAIALVVILDDVIVDIDNAIRRLREAAGETVSRRDVLGAALGEVSSPSLAAMLVVLLVLAPVLAIGGVTGAFVAPFALACAIAIATALVVGLTVTPALASLLYARRAERPEPAFLRTLYRWHQRALIPLLQRPRAAYGVVAVVAIVAVASVTTLGMSLAPTFRERDLMVAVQAAPGTSQPAMNRIVASATEELRELPGVRRVGSHVGRAITSDQVVNIDSGQIWVSVDPAADYDSTVAGVRAVLAGYPGLSLDVGTYLSDRASDVAPTSAAPVAVRVYGPELEELQTQAEAVRTAIASVPGVSAPRIETTPTEPTVEIEVDLAAAAGHGIKPGDVRRAAATLVSGLEVGNLFEEQKVFEVMVVGVPEMRHSLSSIQRLLIDTPDGSQVPLEDVASVQIVSAPVSIAREGISRYVDVVADVSGRDVGAVRSDVLAALAAIRFPMEYHPELSTGWADQQAAFVQLLGVILAVIVIAFLILQAAFESWRLAALSMIALPVAIGGGLVAVVLTGGMLTLGSLIGLLGALAIATRNQVSLVDRFRRLERLGLSPGPGLVIRATRERMGPIVLTALVSVLACAVIIVLGGRPGLELLQPMAIVLIGSLLTSTVVNLFVFPALYLRLTAWPAPASTETETADVTVPGTTPQPAGVQ